MYRLLILFLCLISTISAAVIQEENPLYQKLVKLAAEDAAPGQDYAVKGVFESANGDQENEYTVRLELQDPERLCEVSILDSQPADDSPNADVQYSVLKKECQKPVHETFRQETIPRVCAGCPMKHDINDPKVQKVARFALLHYNEKLGAEDPLPKVRVAQVSTQIVNGVNYRMVLELMKGGHVMKTCDTTVWERPAPYLIKVTKMQCTAGPARDAREGA